MGCLKKRAMIITTGLLGLGACLLYQNIQKRLDDLEEEIWSMEEEELDVCPYCESVYKIEEEENEKLNQINNEFKFDKTNGQDSTDLYAKEE